MYYKTGLDSNYYFDTLFEIFNILFYIDNGLSSFYMFEMLLREGILLYLFWNYSAIDFKS